VLKENAYASDNSFIVQIIANAQIVAIKFKILMK
jgi:hypothetical protein